MKKAINEKTKKINVIYGFFNGNDYGADYPTLMDSVDLVDLFPYLNKGETELKTSPYTDPLVLALRSACHKLNEGRYETTSKHTYYVEVDTMKYEPTIHVCFRIVENTIEPLNTNVTREQAVAEAGEKTIKELENYWGF